MTGKIVYTPTSQHCCRPPKLQPMNGKWQWADEVIHHGTVWECECGGTWRFTLSPFSHKWLAGEEPWPFKPTWLPETEEQKRERETESSRSVIERVRQDGGDDEQ